jgi:four helix bundle protein
MYDEYKDLVIWKKSVNLIKKIDRIALKHDASTDMGVFAHIKKSAESIPSSLAEGFSRNGIKEFRTYLYIAKWSVSELATQVIIVKEFKYINEYDYNCLLENINEIGGILSGLIKSAG